MRPAFSVVFLTTLIGIGQGLFLALFTTEVYSAFHLLPPQNGHLLYGIGSLLALTFLALGLLASFFHLGHPERAWRTAARWKTSWLSREVIVLPLFMLTVLAYGIVHCFDLNTPLLTLTSTVTLDLSMLLGVIGTLLCFTLFVCTGMIYACLKFLREWHTPLTVINFILLGSASGFTVTALFSLFAAPDLISFYTWGSIVLTVAALVARSASLVRNRRLKSKSNLQTAIGVRHNRIVQKAQGFMGGSFNTREFFHGKTPQLLRLVKWGALLLAFLLPLLLLWLGLFLGAWLLFFFAVLFQYAGLLADRWFFFAQANHPQNIYYQSIA